MPKTITPAGEAGRQMHRTREALIRSRDSLTRFSYAHGPLCRWPGLTPEQVREAVLRELEALKQG